MRNSNIILCGMFIGAVIMMTVLQASVYKKEKNNEIEDGTFYRNKNEREKYTTTPLQPFTSLKVDYAANVWIGYGSEYKVLVENNERDKITIKQEGNTLMISQKKNEEAMLDLRYNYIYRGSSRIIIYCPSFSSIQLDHSSIAIDSFPAANISKVKLTANNAGFYLNNYNYEEHTLGGGSIIFNDLQVELNESSTFELNYNYVANKLLLNANGRSQIRLKNLQPIDSLQMNIGDSCSIEMQGKVLNSMKR